MDYRKLIEMVSVSKREALSSKLMDVILLSKNDEKMPGQLANTILHHWQSDTLMSESALTALFEAAVLLEPDKTISAFVELELTDPAQQIRETVAKT